MNIADFELPFEDPSILDPQFPPAQISFQFINAGSRIHGNLWLAQGDGAKPCVIISQQMFGGDCLESVTFPLFNAGFNVLTYVPRGMRDGQQYTLMSALEDLNALIDCIGGKGEVLGTPFEEARSRLDPSRIALFGLSGGGGTVSFAGCAQSETVHHAIAVAPSNIDAQLSPEIIEQARDGFEKIGRLDLWDGLLSMTDADKARISIIQQSEKLVPKHLLLIGAGRDETSPLDVAHRPIARALRAAGAQHLTEVILDTDHMILTKRKALARLLLRWLRHSFA